MSDTLRYYMKDTAAAKSLLYRRLRALSNYENAEKALDKARAKNKDVQQVRNRLLRSPGSDCPGYPGIRGYLKRQGTRVAIRHSKYPSVKKNFFLLFIFLFKFFYVLKIRTAVFLIHLCVFMDTAISILFHCLAIYYNCKWLI